MLDPRPELRSHAQEVVRAFAARAGALPELERAALRELIGELAATWEHHRCASVLEAAIVLLGPGVRGRRNTGCRLRQWFAKGDEPGHAAMRSLLRRLEGAEARVRAWEWLGGDEAGAASSERVSWAKTIDEHEQLLARGHLVERPSRRRRVRMVAIKPERRGLLPSPEEAGQLSVDARRGLVRVLSASNAPQKLNAAWWERLRSDADEGVRHLAMRLGPRPDTESPSTQVMDGPGWARWLSADPGAAVADLRRRINEPGTAMEGIAAARRLGLESEVELELMRAATGHRAEEVIASAVAALGRVPGASARSLIEACLGHSVPRVRSNAIEAIARREPLREVMVRVAETDGEHHRVRATGAWAAWRWGAAEAAGAVVSGMLRDERALQRVAALWVLGRAARSGMLQDEAAAGGWSRLLTEMAASDREDGVRARALWCAERVHASVRSAWRGRTATV